MFSDKARFLFQIDFSESINNEQMCCVVINAESYVISRLIRLGMMPGAELTRRFFILGV
jgi:hypothetical protein